MNRSPGSLLSFVYVGILLVLTVAGIVLFSWLLLLGAITGLFLYVLFWIRLRFFSRERSHPVTKRSGRVIDHDDIDPPV